MVNVGKREDGLLDFVNAMKNRIDLAVMEIELFRESGGITARETEILNAIHRHLQVPPKAESE